MTNSATRSIALAARIREYVDLDYLDEAPEQDWREVIYDIGDLPDFSDRELLYRLAIKQLVQMHSQL